MLSGLRDRVVPPAEMKELWELAKKRSPKKNTGWFSSAFGPKDEEESLIVTQPDKDVFETFYAGNHSALSSSLTPSVMNEFIGASFQMTCVCIISIGPLLPNFWTVLSLLC
jgi:hypothetical protein